VAEPREPTAPDESNSAAPWTPRPPVLLHVVDHERGFELKDVEVRSFGGVFIMTPALPDDSESTAILRGDSPLTLEDARDRRRAEMTVVRAPGYAPKRLSIDFQQGGDREVALDRGASLEVRVRGRPAGEKARLRLRPLEQVRRCANEHVVQMQ